MGHDLHSHFQGFHVRSSTPGQAFFAGSQDIPRSHKSIRIRRLPVHGKFTLYPVTLQLPKEYILEASLGQKVRTNGGQVEGIIMDNPLGPTMANFSLTHLEEKIFAENSNGSLLSKPVIPNH